MTEPDSAKPDWAQSRHEKDNAARRAAGLKPRRRRWPWIVLVLLVIVAVAGYFYLSRGPAPVTPDAAPAPVMQLNPLEITTIAPQTLVQTVKVTGSLAPQRQAQVASQVSGRVVAVMTRPGDAVRAGDVLLQLDTESLRIQLNQQTSTAEATSAQLVLADSQLARTRDLIERGLTASSGLEEAQAGADALRANLAALQGQVEAARIALTNATLKSSMAGIVSERSVEPGQSVQAGSPLLTIVDLDSLDLIGAAPVGASAQIKPGQSVNISIEGLPGQRFTGTVERVNPVAAAGTRTVPIYIALDNAQRLLRGGMFATGQVAVAQQPDALAVPKNAIREDAEGFFLLKLADGAVVRQAIEQGDVWNGGQLVHITSGLVAGDVVVTAPLTQLLPGNKVELVEG